MIEKADVVLEEGDQPDLVIHLFNSHVLFGKGSTKIDFLTVVAVGKVIEAGLLLEEVLGSGNRFELRWALTPVVPDGESVSRKLAVSAAIGRGEERVDAAGRIAIPA